HQDPSAGPRGRRAVVRVKRVAPGYQFDPVVAVAHLRESDPLLATVISRVGDFAMELQGARSLFEALLRSIIYQQLHARAAEKIHGRVLALLKTRGGAKPVALMKATDAELRAAGLSAA